MKHNITQYVSRYMYVTSDATRAEMLTRMDEYGDHYTKHVKEDQLKEVCVAEKIIIVVTH